MERIKLTRNELINEFEKGKTIRVTCGIWNSPNKSGRIVASVKELDSFYSWASLVDVYQGTNGVDYELIGASHCDMF